MLAYIERDWAAVWGPRTNVPKFQMYFGDEHAPHQHSSNENEKMRFSLVRSSSERTESQQMEMNSSELIPDKKLLPRIEGIICSLSS